MIQCAICTRHPHAPDDDCTDDCRTTEADLGIICTRCADRIRRDLDALVDAWAATENPAFPGGSSGDGRAKSSPLPGGTDWMDFRQGADLFGILGTWVRDWCDVYALKGPKYSDLTSITGWLRAHLPHAANSHPAIDDFADEVRKLAQRARRLAGEVPDRGQRVPCPTDDCGRVLRYARLNWRRRSGVSGAVLSAHRGRFCSSPHGLMRGCQGRPPPMSPGHDVHPATVGEGRPRPARTWAILATKCAAVQGDEGCGVSIWGTFFALDGDSAPFESEGYGTGIADCRMGTFGFRSPATLSSCG